jgi:hypothetical protein
MTTAKRLKELLDLETYPMNYTHKFIGKNTKAFLRAIDELEENFPQLDRISARESQATQINADASYLALTYEFVANSSDEIIEVLEATSKLEDLKVIL